MQKEERPNSQENLLQTEIETERLILRPVSFDCKNEIFSEFTAEVTKYMCPSPPEHMEDIEKFIAESIEKMEKGTDYIPNIFDKETGEFLGGAGLHNIDTRTPEPGIWLKKSAQGNGRGLEAIKALKEWADKNLDYDYLLYPVAKENFASRKIPEALGGKLIREFVGKKHNGEEMEEVEYRIYKVKTGV